MGYTHLQPAEPTTLGYRLAGYAQDLLVDDANLRFVFENLTTKGLRGAVGTGGIVRAAGSIRAAARRDRSVRPRAIRSDLRARSARRPTRASSIICCSPPWPGWAHRSRSSQPTFGCSRARASAKSPNRSAQSQVGSSVMPFKQNPILSERIGSLARLVARLRRRRVAERGDELSRAHARRQRQPPRRPSRGACSAPTRSSRSRERSIDGSARRRAPHRGEPAHLRTVRGHRRR